MSTTVQALFEQLPPCDADVAVKFGEIVSPKLHLCMTPQSPSQALENDARDVVNIFRARLALVLKAKQPVSSVLAAFETYADVLRSAGGFQSSIEMGLSSFDEAEVPDVLAFARQLAG